MFKYFYTSVSANYLFICLSTMTWYSTHTTKIFDQWLSTVTYDTTHTVPQGRVKSVLETEPDLTPVGKMLVTAEETPVDLRDFAPARMIELTVNTSGSLDHLVGRVRDKRLVLMPTSSNRMSVVQARPTKSVYPWMVIYTLKIFTNEKIRNPNLPATVL